MDTCVPGIKYCIRYVENVESSNIYNPIRPSEDKIARMNKKNSWFLRLERSILENGIRNPIVVDARFSPSKELVRLRCRYGGSRLMVAQKHRLTVPCIIADHDNIFPNGLEIAAEDIRTYYHDQPKVLKVRLDSIYMDGCKDIHMKD